MKTKTVVHVNIIPAGKILARLGVDRKGDVQGYVTATVNKYMTPYMPFSTGALATKLKFIKSKTEIEVLGPYARMQYYPWVMVDAKTGKGPANIPGVGPRFRKGTVLKTTKMRKDYGTSKNQKAGPYWDRRMMAEKRGAITREINEYAKNKTVKL